MRHSKRERLHVMADLLEGCHATKLSEGAGLESNGDIFEEMRRRFGCEVMADEAEVEQCLLVQVGEKDIATVLCVPESEKRWTRG